MENRAQDPLVEVILNGPEWLVVAISNIPTPAGDVIPWFVEPEKLKGWWGIDHRIVPAVGGEYVIGWPHIGRTLTGQIAEISETRLMFSWNFDHEPDLPPRMAAISVHQQGDAARIEIRHGPYRADDSDAEERTGHLEGWTYFLPLLVSAIAEL